MFNWSKYHVKKDNKIEHIKWSPLKPMAQNYIGRNGDLYTTAEYKYRYDIPQQGISNIEVNRQRRKYNI